MMSVKVPTNVNNVRQNWTHMSMNDNKTSLSHFTVGFHANWGDINALNVKLNYPADYQNSPVIDYGFGCTLIGRALELTSVVTFDGRTSVFFVAPTTNHPHRTLRAFRLATLTVSPPDGLFVTIAASNWQFDGFTCVSY